MDDFFTSESAFTPLMAGTFTLTTAATLASTFNWQGSLTASVISLILASLISIDKSIKLFKRVIFYFINATTIFIIAMGLNSAGMSLTQTQAKKAPDFVERGLEVKDEPSAFFHQWF